MSDGAPGTGPLTVLVSSAGRRVELVRAFRDVVTDLTPGGRVLATDSSWFSSAFHEADEGVVVPRVTDPALEPMLLDLCERHGVDLVVPTTDREMPFWVGARDRFAAIGTTVALSGAEVVAIASDKQRTHDWLTANGFPTVRQARPAEALADPAAWPLPLMAKPRYGSASEGVGLVRTREHLELVAARDDALSDGTPGDMVVQTVATGVEHTIDVLVDRSGLCLCAVPRRRLEVRGGEVSKALTVRSAELIELAHGMCKALPEPYGVLNFQVFAGNGTGATGELAVIEINPRFGGGFPLSYRAGADYPRWLLQDLRGLPTPGAAEAADAWQDGLAMLRYDAAVFVDAARAPGQGTG